MQELKNYVLSKGYHVDDAYSDIASGISFKNQKQFFKMLDLILAGKVKRVIITHKDRLSRIGFELFEDLFQNYSTEIDAVSDEMNPKLMSRNCLKRSLACFTAFQ